MISLRSKREKILLAAVGSALATAVLALLKQPEPSPVAHPIELPAEPLFRSEASPLPAGSDDPSAANDRECLRRWADGIETTAMPAKLERIQRLDSARREALREALLFSWTGRDLVAVARWVGTLGPAHALQQEGREQLVLALLQCDPEQVVPALRESLPEATSRELLGPYFRALGGASPAAAAGMLARLAASERRNPTLWHDLGAQVAAQWIAVDPSAAIAWVRSLPEGGGKSAALLQTSYRWTKVDPVGASAYAATSEDLRFVRAVAGKWAETAPSAALAWARTLPAGSARTEALSGAGAIWAQSDPQAAAAYVSGLGDTAMRADLATAVAGAWAFSDPRAAGAWVQGLPADASRDAALVALANALRFGASDHAFAQTAQPTLR